MLSLVVAAALAMPFSQPVETAPAQETALLANFTPVLEAIRHRPRRYPRDPDHDRDRHDSGSSARGFSQLHAGFYSPEDDTDANVLFGFRGGASFDDHLQMGIGFDWSHRGNRSAAVISESPLPGGGTTVRREELARSSLNLLPMMAFVQASPGEGLAVRPYLGVGGGYQVLFVSADDFESGTSYDATFGGWGWQAWAGVAFPLSGRARMNAEIYMNRADVEREVDDSEFGGRVREIVDVDGAGMRFGVSWGF